MKNPERGEKGEGNGAKPFFKSIPIFQVELHFSGRKNIAIKAINSSKALII
jgi:hypothetical protein